MEPRKPPSVLVSILGAFSGFTVLYSAFGLIDLLATSRKILPFPLAMSHLSDHPSMLVDHLANLVVGGLIFGIALAVRQRTRRTSGDQKQMTKRSYTKPGRLADVLALIQVLAFDPDTHRSESGIINKELGPPSSSDDGWITLAKEHRELFRVSDEATHALSLVARHVQPSDPTKKRPPLSPEFTQVLIETALELHDRQVEAADRWRYFMPAAITGVLVLLSALLTQGLAQRSKTSGRFVEMSGTSGFEILIDTSTGQVCYPGGTGLAPPGNKAIPACRDLH